MAKKIDIESDLRERFPDAFQTDSASQFRFDCGEGWFGIVATLCSLLCEANRQVDQDPAHLVGAVEKMGTLRILVSGRSPLAEAWIKFAVQHATSTCEICGGTGRLLYIDGWQRVRCAPHASTPRLLDDND